MKNDWAELILVCIIGCTFFSHRLHLNVFYNSSLNDAIYKLYILGLLTSSCRWHINSSTASCTLAVKWWTHGIQSDIFLWRAEFLKCFGRNTVVTLARFYLYCKYGLIYFTSTVKQCKILKLSWFYSFFVISSILWNNISIFCRSLILSPASIY